MSLVRRAALAFLPLVAAAAFAQAPSAAPYGPSGAPALNFPGVSPAGNASLTRLYRAPDPAFRMILGQLKDLSSQLQLEAQRPDVDMDKITTLLRKRESLLAQSQTRQDDRVIAALKALAPDDRAPFLRAISHATGGTVSTPAR